jgi:hypothetical protein
MASSLLGLIMCINKKFQTKPPIPNATTKIEVDLFFALGNCVHMQLRTGTEISEYIAPGIIIPKMVKT